MIRDDNSNDGTKELIDKWERDYPGKVKVIRDDPTGETPNANLRTSQNFSRLMEAAKRESDAHYIMFSDQDDIWHPDKIAVSLRKIKELEDIERKQSKDTPLLAHSDIALCDSEDKIITASAKRSQKKHPEQTGIGRLLVEEPITGMTMIMNRPLLDRAAPVPREASMHDSWVSKVAAVTGKIAYIDQSLADHRVHGKNVSGIHEQVAARSFAARARDKLSHPMHALEEKKRFFGQRLVDSATIASVLLERFGSEMGTKEHATVAACVELPSLSPMARRASMLRHGIYPAGGRGKLETIAFTSQPHISMAVPQRSAQVMR